MVVVAIIPARLQSTRLPEKALTPISGKPLIAWVVANARRAASLSRILVATDDERIARAAREAGAEAVMTSPNHPTGTDRVAEAAAGLGADVYVNIQGDEPEVSPSTIDAVVHVIENDRDLDMSTAAVAIRTVEEYESPHRVKVVTDDRRHALYFSRSPIPYWRSDGESVPLADRLGGGDVLGHVGIYGYTADALQRVVRLPPSPLERWERLEQLRALQAGMRIGVVLVAESRPGIDTPEDLEAFRRRVERGT